MFYIYALFVLYWYNIVALSSIGSGLLDVVVTFYIANTKCFDVECDDKTNTHCNKCNKCNNHGDYNNMSISSQHQQEYRDYSSRLIQRI